MKPEFIPSRDWAIGVLPAAVGQQRPIAHWSSRFRLFKFTFDICLSLVALPFIVLLGLVLLILNPFLNPGKLVFRQQRMGFQRRPFTMWKFRTMTHCSDSAARDPHAPVEVHRITPLGRILRKYRLDELPNFFCVLRGEMSVIGPRPDAFDHAVRFDGTIAYYSDRFRVLPGITGLAQVQGGYADTERAIERKARLDHHYVKFSRIKMDLFIMRRTVAVLLTGFGAK